MLRCLVSCQLLIACLAVVNSLPRTEVVVDQSRRPSSNLSVRQREGLANSTRGGGQGGIVFPTEKPLSENPLSDRSNCVGNICENVPDYPQTLLENMLVDYATEYRALFGNDELDGPIESIQHRVGSPDEIPLCESRVHIIYPQKAEDKDGKLRYVVNTGEHKQGVRIETCVSNGEKETPCAFFEPFVSKTICKQKFIYRRLVAFNNGSLEAIQFPLPSCCMCMVQKSKKEARHNNKTNSSNNSEVATSIV